MEELSDRQSTTSECQPADDNIDDTQIVEYTSPVTPQSVNPVPGPSLDVSGGWSSQDLKEENDDCGTSSKKKKKKKKKKKQLVSADIGSSVDDNNVDGSVVYSSPPTTGQTESEGKQEGFLSERISGLLSGESENPQESSTVTKKKKKKKKKKKETTESAEPVSSTYDELVPYDDESEAHATQIAKNVPSQLSVSSTAVQETQEIGKDTTENHKDSDLKPGAAIFESNVDNQQRVGSTGQPENTLALPDSNIQDNLNVQGDWSATKKKKKKKKKRKKKQENDDDTQPSSESTGAVLATDDHSEMVSETPSPKDQPGKKNGKEQVSSAKEKSCVSDVMPETMQDEKDTVTTATTEPCKKGPATSGYRDETNVDVKPADEDSSRESQSVQEV